jgi:hypothetical protein
VSYTVGVLLAVGISVGAVRHVRRQSAMAGDRS